MDEFKYKAPKKENTPRVILIVLSLFTIGVWFIPYGTYFLYPFVIFGTWVHELSHGLASLFMGARFIKLELFPNGSGVAYFAYHSLFLGRLGVALIAAAGPMGPAIAGAAAISCSKSAKASKNFLRVFSIVMLISLVLWVRPIFSITYAIIVLIAVITFYIARSKNVNFITAYIQLIGLQCLVSMLLSIDYLFTNTAQLAGNAQSTDTQVIADNLFLPHWFWAVLIIASAILLFYKSIKTIVRK
jgi:hypothetical protein